MENLFGQEPIKRKLIRSDTNVKVSVTVSNSDKIEQLELYIEKEIKEGKVVPNFIYEQLAKYKGEVEEVKYVVSSTVKQKVVLNKTSKTNFSKEYNSWFTVRQWKVKWKEELPEWLYEDAIYSYSERHSTCRAKDLSYSLSTGLDSKKNKIDFDIWHKFIMFLRNGGDSKNEELKNPSTALLFLYNLKD